jgi:hypothetical protein
MSEILGPAIDNAWRNGYLQRHAQKQEKQDLNNMG